jgi:hypothetical protein
MVETQINELQTVAVPNILLIDFVWATILLKALLIHSGFFYN